MSKKELKRVHIEDIEFIYVVKKGFPDGTHVNVYRDGDKSKTFCVLEFEEYTSVTPGMVKEGIINLGAETQIDAKD